MTAAEVRAIIGRDPDATLSGHEEAHPDGTPASSWTLDAWYSPGVQGRGPALQVRYRGALVDDIQCAVPPALAASLPVSPSPD